MNGLPSCGWGPWRSDFYSFCSKHHPTQNQALTCPACAAGVWANRWVHNIDSFIYEHFRQTWLWWHNRENSKTRRVLEEHFPNLRKPAS